MFVELSFCSLSVQHVKLTLNIQISASEIALMLFVSYRETYEIGHVSLFASPAKKLRGKLVVHLL